MDQEKPVIDIDISIYNGSRYESYGDLSFNITDNYSSDSDLKVYLSLNEKANISLFSPFELSLSSLTDGDYEFYLYVFKYTTS